MVKIALIGNEKSETVSNTLRELLKMADKTVFCYETTKYGTFRQLADNAADVFIAPLGYYLLEQTKQNIDVFIFSNASPPEGRVLNLINKDAYIIINADDRHTCNYLQGTTANLLTYGFNPKASVTASSIEQNMERNFIQLCIQRSFQAINGKNIEAQEIPVTLSTAESGGVLDEIAAITASLALGINIRTISLAY